MLTDMQILIVGLIASIVVPVLTQISKWYYAKTGKELSKRVVTFVAFGLSLITAGFFAANQFPATLPSDPMEVLGAIIVWASAVFGVAVLIYNLLLKAIFEKARFV
jgi:hypothetical protein